jgi:hypothetical protein
MSGFLFSFICYIIGISMKVFISIIIFLVLALILFFGAGYLAPIEYQKSKSATFEDKQGAVWNAIVDIEKYVDRKKDIQKVEIVEKQFGAIKKWKEYYKTTTLEYEITRQEKPRIFTINVKDNFKKIDRDIEYFLNTEDNRTRLTVSEVSRAEHIFWRGATTLLGRDNFIDRELKWVRVALFQKLLNSD